MSKRKFDSHYPTKDELQYLMDTHQFEAAQKRAKDMTLENMRKDIVEKRKYQSLIIPLQIIRMIALYMDVKSIMKLSRGDSIFYEIIQNEEFWERKLYIDMPHYAPFKEMILKNLTAEKIDLRKAPPIGYRPLGVFKGFINSNVWNFNVGFPPSNVKFIRAYFVLSSLSGWVIEDHFGLGITHNDYSIRYVKDDEIHICFVALGISTKITLETYYQKFNDSQTIFQKGRCYFWNNLINNMKNASRIFRLLLKRGHFYKKSKRK